MAYQQQGGLANGPGGSGEHHGPQGTEYTLQGKLSTLGWDEISLEDGASGVEGQHADLPFAQVSCASYKSNGTTTSAPETPGILNAQR
jgi:hypothetical protein